MVRVHQKKIQTAKTFKGKGITKLPIKKPKGKQVKDFESFSPRTRSSPIKRTEATKDSGSLSSLTKQTKGDLGSFSPERRSPIKRTETTKDSGSITSRTSLSPVKELFIKQVINARRNLSSQKDTSQESNKSLNKSFDKSPKKSNQSTVNKTQTVNNRSRRKSVPRKTRIRDEFTGVTSMVSSKTWREIRTLQNQTKNVIPVAPFLRLVKELLYHFGGHDYRIQRSALEALQGSCEMYMTQFFQDCYLCTIHSGRVTLMCKDMQLARRLRGGDDIINR